MVVSPVPVQQLWWPSAADFSAARMSGLPKRTPLKSSAPHVLASTLRAAPKSSRSTREPPGWCCAKEQPWLYALACNPLGVVPYMYQAATGVGAAFASCGSARNALHAATSAADRRAIEGLLSTARASGGTGL